MAESIRLFRGAFGHVSILHVAGDLVTHAHAEAHIIVWLGGASGEMTIGRETIRLGPALAAGINAFEPHSHALSQDGAPGLFLAFYLDPTWLRCRYGLPSARSVFAGPAIRLEPWLHQAAISLQDSLDSCDAVGHLVRYEVEGFIDSVIEAAESGQERPIRTSRSAPDYRVRKAVELMKANVTQRLCFDEVARSVGLSRPHFFALFREQMNLTPNVFWNTLRMEEAVRQLQCSEESLISVACNLGFTTQGNFSRFFRDHVGVPPTLYREAARAAA